MDDVRRESDQETASRYDVDRFCIVRQQPQDPSAETTRRIGLARTFQKQDHRERTLSGGWPGGQVGPVHVRFVEAAGFVAQQVDALAPLERPVEERGDRIALRIE